MLEICSYFKKKKDETKYYIRERESKDLKDMKCRKYGFPMAGEGEKKPARKLPETWRRKKRKKKKKREHCKKGFYL